MPLPSKNNGGQFGSGGAGGGATCKVGNLNVYSAVVSRTAMHHPIISILLTSAFKS
jgi:hypothetical protein